LKNNNKLNLLKTYTFPINTQTFLLTSNARAGSYFHSPSTMNLNCGDNIEQAMSNQGFDVWAMAIRNIVYLMVTHWQLQRDTEKVAPPKDIFSMDHGDRIALQDAMRWMESELSPRTRHHRPRGNDVTWGHTPNHMPPNPTTRVSVVRYSAICLPIHSMCLRQKQRRSFCLSSG